MTDNSELYACLYVKEFPAQALLRLRPELHEKPCVVMEGDPPLQHVCSMNAKARQAGMTYGMTRVEIDSFPQPFVLTRSAKSEATTKAILLECAGTFSPRVEDRSINTAFLCGIDIAGTKSLFGTPEMLARSLLSRARCLGISARVVVSRNLHAAACLARGRFGPSLHVIPNGDEGSTLAPLPLSVLDLTEAHAETFALWGIYTLGMLASLPETDLIARIGQEGKRLRLLARGERPHLFLPVEPKFTLEEQMELDSPVDSIDGLLFVVSVLLEQLILRAKSRVLALASVTITLNLNGGSSHTRTVRTALPTTDKQLWIKLIHLDLEAHPTHASILFIALLAESGSTSKLQLGLFSPQLPEASRLDITLARIRGIVGENNVGRAMLLDTHAPESFRLEPFAALFKVPFGDAASSRVLAPRASQRQLRPAEAVSVTLQNTRPTAFFFRDHRFLVEHSYGPWVAGGEWWNQSLWATEQWDVIAKAQDDSLLCCCMMCDRMRNRWQIAALYD